MSNGTSLVHRLSLALIHHALHRQLHPPPSFYHRGCEGCPANLPAFWLWLHKAPAQHSMLPWVKMCFPLADIFLWNMQMKRNAMILTSTTLSSMGRVNYAYILNGENEFWSCVLTDSTM